MSQVYFVFVFVFVFGRVPSSALLRDLLDAPTALAACCGFDLCHKYILYLYLYLYLVRVRGQHVVPVQAAEPAGAAVLVRDVGAHADWVLGGGACALRATDSGDALLAAGALRGACSTPVASTSFVCLFGLFVCSARTWGRRARTRWAVALVLDHPCTRLSCACPYRMLHVQARLWRRACGRRSCPGWGTHALRA